MIEVDRKSSLVAALLAVSPAHSAKPDADNKNENRLQQHHLEFAITRVALCASKLYIYMYLCI